MLLDTRGSTDTFGLGIDREMALAIYRVGSEQEYAEVNKYCRSKVFLTPTRKFYDIFFCLIVDYDKLISSLEFILNQIADLSLGDSLRKKISYTC